MSEEFRFWYSRLAGEDTPYPDQPQPGRYRLMARKTNSAEGRPAPKSWPVGIWRDEATSKLRVLIGTNRLLIEGEEAFAKFTAEGWQFAVAIRPEEYNTAFQTGSFPDEHEAVTRSNQAPPPDSFEELSDRVDDLAREAAKLIEGGAATTQEQCDRAADLANLLGQMERKADELRRVEKKPHEEAAREVDGRWNPIRDRAADGKTGLKAKVCTPFLRELDRQREAAEFAALTTGAPDPHPAERAKVTAGTRGRPVGMRVKKTVTIIDRSALLSHFAEHADITTALQSLAERSVRAGITPPGVTVKESKEAA